MLLAIREPAYTQCSHYLPIADQSCKSARIHLLYPRHTSALYDDIIKKQYIKHDITSRLKWAFVLLVQVLVHSSIYYLLA